MVSIMRRVYQTFGKRLRGSAIEFSDTTPKGSRDSRAGETGGGAPDDRHVIVVFHPIRPLIVVTWRSVYHLAY